MAAMTPDSKIPSQRRTSRRAVDRKRQNRTASTQGDSCCSNGALKGRGPFSLPCRSPGFARQSGAATAEWPVTWSPRVVGAWGLTRKPKRGEKWEPDGPPQAGRLRLPLPPGTKPGKCRAIFGANISFGSGSRAAGSVALQFLPPEWAGRRFFNVSHARSRVFAGLTTAIEGVSRICDEARAMKKRPSGLDWR